MKYFVRSGPIASNKSGVGARGWGIERAGTIVVVHWGPVEVRRRSNDVSFYWKGERYPQKTKYVSRTETMAKELVATKVRQQRGKHASGRYEALPSRHRIRKHRGG